MHPSVLLLLLIQISIVCALAPPISPDLKHVLQGSWCTQGDSIGEHAERLQPGFEPDPN